jgi:monoamine oxidase
MSAAWTLKQKWVNEFLILEWRDRVWGRIFSEPQWDKFVAELWAERIGKTHTHLLKLIDELNHNNSDPLRLVDHTFSDEIHLHHSTATHCSGELCVKNEDYLTSFFEQFSSWQDPIIEERYDSYSVEALIRELNTNQYDEEIADLENSNEFGESMKTMAASRFIINSLSGWESNHCDYKIRGGNQRICTTIQESIGNQHLLTNKKITTITKTNIWYTVLCSDWSSYNSRYLICSLPLSTRLSIQRSGLLSDAKRNFLHQVTYNRIFKGWFVIDAPDLEDEFGILTDSLLHTVYNTGKSESWNSIKMIGLYSTGDRAFILAKQSDQAIFEELKKEWIYPKVTWYKKCYRYYRWEDSFVNWWFAVFPPGTYCSWIRTFAEQEGNCFFAWEHTSMQFQWFMEWGCETWIKAAEQVSKLLS